MLQFLYSSSKEEPIEKLEELKSGAWLRCEEPSEDEIATLIELGVDEDVLADTLDPHEVPRIETEGDWTYLITRLPDVSDNFNDFTTPILFGINKQHILTVSQDPLGRMWQPFIDTTKVRTSHRSMLFMLMVDAIINQYFEQVATINRQVRAVTSNVHQLSSADIATLTEYERKLNDYLDALIPTNSSMEQLILRKLLPLGTSDEDEVEDLSIDLEQIIARCKSLLRTITNIRDSYRAVMDTKLNETIRLLTIITVALTIPTMAAAFYGMNVDLPGGEHPAAFFVIAFVSAVVAIMVILYFMRKR